LQERTDSVASGFVELVDLLRKEKIPVIIVYDTDIGDGYGAGNQKYGLGHQVAAAAARLGYELRYRGVPLELIRSYVLNPGPSYTLPKLGVDDYVLHPGLGIKIFRDICRRIISEDGHFPRHPNPAEFVNKRLQRGKLLRSDLQNLSTAVLCDLDAKGVRYHSPDDGRHYYFDKGTFRLLPVKFALDDEFPKTTFGIHMYRTYNVTASDFRLLAILAAQFSGEQPMKEVRPEKVMCVRGEKLYYDLGTGRQIRVDKDGVTFLNNGDDECLFSSDQVAPANEARIKASVLTFQRSRQLDCRWYEVLKDVRVAPSKNDNQRRLLALLYSISPWFYRWHNTQLPLEMMTGEAGSGKSSLFALRMTIITGKPKLRNAPKDMRDWRASVANSGGLHITDNVHMSDNGLRQELSDELCRVITADVPEIEARKLYTDNDLVVIPVQTVFGITAIKQPFNNVDIIQRSIITELVKGVATVEYEENWAQHQLEKWGGREDWIAWQMVFQERLFREIAQDWQTGYRAKFRLINVEQLLVSAAKVMGWEYNWIPDHLEAQSLSQASDADNVLSGLTLFAEQWRKSYQDKSHKRFRVKDICEWAEGEDDYKKTYLLTNSRALGKYIKSHANTVAKVAGIEEMGMAANATTYWTVPVNTF
jgi:hypothetical protein